MNTKDTHEASRLVSAAYCLQDMMTASDLGYITITSSDSEPRLVSPHLPDSVAREIIGAALGIIYARIERLGGRGLVDQLSERDADMRRNS